MRLRLDGPDGERVYVTSERRARELAREMLGVARLTETPTETGWQLWPAASAEDTDQVVTVTVEDES